MATPTGGSRDVRRDAAAPHAYASQIRVPPSKSLDDSVGHPLHFFDSDGIHLPHLSAENLSISPQLVRLTATAATRTWIDQSRPTSCHAAYPNEAQSGNQTRKKW
ncbi:hypothetical protein Y032_0035g3120 [Ancylostoma ceylanicum]|uniref:Uncharacterized protein n=1 Tax=Ancylostoma ceylanicum TaxID=53326 RepID=A0A016UMD4_9BILA|nr:hypothetical protein Y032_0035g3120 [Ancylostoma ceylanicum]